MNKSLSMKRHGLVVIALLIGQYVLGMLINLYASFPEGDPEQHWKSAQSNMLVMSHIVVGLLVLVSAFALYIRAIRAKDRNWRLAAGSGFGSIVLAIISGSEFVSSQNDIYSLAMSAFFIIALGSMTWGVYKSKTLN